ncbi:MAG TPA: hypothetical protein VGO66_10640 [Solirubrobacterales bacterium]|nr:hypothetical protein [Solirubrobacterales bacterium]
MAVWVGNLSRTQSQRHPLGDAYHRRRRPAGNFAAAMETAFYVGASMLAVGYVACRILMP